MKYLLPLAGCLMLLGVLAGCDLFGTEHVEREMVVFASDRGAGEGTNIWRMTPDGGDLQQITFYEEGDYWPADVSPDGRRLLFYRYDARTLTTAIYEMNLDGSPPSPEEYLVGALATAGSYFPDGERFVYDRFIWPTDTTGHQAIFVYDRRDSSSVQLTPENVHLYDPEASSDGRLICFAGNMTAAPRTEQIYLMEVATRSIEAITPLDNRMEECDFTSNGQRVLMSSYGTLVWKEVGTPALHEVVPQRHTKTPASGRSGNRIFFRTGGGNNPTEESEIAVMNLDGSDYRLLTEDTHRDGTPVVAVVEVER